MTTFVIAQVPMSMKLEAAALSAIEKIKNAGMSEPEMIEAISSGKVWEWARELILKSENVEVTLP